MNSIDSIVSERIDDAMENFDCSENVADALKDHDFSDAIKDELQDFDFSEVIEKYLDSPKFAVKFRVLLKRAVRQVFTDFFKEE
jgi:hypothetical protein